MEFSRLHTTHLVNRGMLGKRIGKAAANAIVWLAVPMLLLPTATCSPCCQTTAQGTDCCCVSASVLSGSSCGQGCCSATSTDSAACGPRESFGSETQALDGSFEASLSTGRSCDCHSGQIPNQRATVPLPKQTGADETQAPRDLMASPEHYAVSLPPRRLGERAFPPTALRRCVCLSRFTL